MPTIRDAAQRVVLWFRVVLVALVLLAGTGTLAPAQAEAHGASPGSPPGQSTVYVVNSGSDTVTPIATATNIPGPPIPVGDDPGSIAITPDGRTAYVLNEGSETVTPIATATNTAGPPIPVEGYPSGIVFSPDGSTAYVLSGSVVIPIATATNTAGAPIQVEQDATAIAITPDGKTLYVANWTAGTITPIATATGTAGAPITVGTNPNFVAVTPDGTTAYVENWTSGTVTPISTATNTPQPPIAVGSGPDWMAITPDGSTLYVANLNSGTVTPITTATNTAGASIPVGFDTYFLAITPDSKTAYVDRGGAVLPLTTATDTLGPPITGNGFIAITPDSKTVYVTNFYASTVTPIATATNTAGTPIPVGSLPNAIAITPATTSHPPVFTSRPAATAAFSVPFTFTVTTTGNPAAWISRTGRLPSGLKFTPSHDGTATISGTPAHGAAGTYPLTLTATNTAGTATQTFTLTVTRAPTIRRIHTIRARAGLPLHRTIHTHGYPAAALTETGPLPAGLSFNDTGHGTAVIAGTPATGTCGQYQITITATNPSGSATQSTALRVSPHHRHC